MFSHLQIAMCVYGLKAILCTVSLFHAHDTQGEHTIPGNMPLLDLAIQQ